MNRSTSKKLFLAVLVAALVGAGGGAGLYAVLAPSSGSTTIVRQVPVRGGSSPATAQDSLSVTEIYRLARKGVVEITVTEGNSSFPGAPKSQAQGSGFVYDKRGDVVTNQHVVDGAQSISVKFWNGATYKAHLVGEDPSTDVAVLKVDAPASLLSPLALGDSSKMAVGEGVVAIGSPFGLEETVTSGIVSALHRQMKSPNGYSINDSIQTDAAINHGNSGGPLLDLHGRVIGINAQIAGDSGGNEGVGFAIPADSVRSIVTQLVSTGKAEHAYLGISMETIPASAGAKLGLPEGAEIDQVKPRTPAANAGLRAATGTRLVDGAQYATGGDVITRIDGKRVRSAEDLQSVIGGYKPGDRITITFVRHGKKQSVSLTLGNRPS